MPAQKGHRPHMEKHAPGTAALRVCQHLVHKGAEVRAPWVRVPWVRAPWVRALEPVLMAARAQWPQV